ncbi:MAG: MerR family transcriptional regulator, heat shock protein HspR [Verrucomicrobia bacterium]|nr:MAG: MerR family transcriptional regulator, heat shock protein HspR [Verrucomicrobiota bacterium]
MNPPDSSSLDLIAQLSGLSHTTVLHYHAHGLLTPATTHPADSPAFDDATIHRLHRIEHLRTAYGMEIAALHLTLSLFDEIDSLRSTLRASR